MNMESLIAAFLVGLLGGTHCIGMCGGIVGALTAGLSTDVRDSRLRLFITQLTYNTGRVASYVAAGVIAGVLGQQVSVMELTGGFPLGRVVAGVVMILLGFYLGGWWHALRWLERLGACLWKFIEPLGRRFIPVRNPGQALLLGLVWGWLPCGMVYAVLALALASGSGMDGGAIMLAFGAGTLPTMLTLGVAFSSLGRWVRDERVRKLAGISVILLGLFLLLAIPGAQGHHAHPH
ncbi:MAG: sulfite exporter TauE/SafE family protein [Gammaproteobacteria bacterium]|nr:sulfite exporter TauE/SafE family protein [Gammaproteobacteria bacterium]